MELKLPIQSNLSLLYIIPFVLTLFLTSVLSLGSSRDTTLAHTCNKLLTHLGCCDRVT